MRVRPSSAPANGILVVNKPRGMTSHDAVDFARRKLATRKVGHAGTLDPGATGVLVLLVGDCTRLFDSFMKLDKEYEAEVALGKKTSTADSSGRVLEERDCSHVTRAMVEKALTGFLGAIRQVPPMVSAVKHKGTRLYKLARRGASVERAARTVVIKELRLLSFSPPHFRLFVKCSRGTYVRQLAEDLAAALGCVGHISEIKRLSVGPHSLDNALALEEISPEKVLPVTAIP